MTQTTSRDRNNIKQLLNELNEMILGLPDEYRAEFTPVLHKLQDTLASAPKQYDPEVVDELIDFVVKAMKVLEKKWSEGLVVNTNARNEYNRAKPIIAKLKGIQ